MKRKIKIILSLLLLFVSLGLTAQSNNQTTLQKLINKDWVLIHEVSGYESYVCKINYTTTKSVISVIHNGVTSYDEGDDSDFYLSDQIETTFDYSKVGNVQNGKYIIEYIPDLNGESIFHVDEIITITDTYLEIKSHTSGKTYKYTAQ
ncbi:MAG: hypothetical protein LBJ63_04345 [Prevotellaceae bacterium]|jgi:hypothetical protein|nr:hypothetical protein [Prevotellaceae bacterium]